MADELVRLGDLARGAVGELFAAELIEVGKNILDINTDAKTKRRIVIAVEFAPEDDERREVGVHVSVKSSLAPLRKVRTRLFFRGRAGQVLVAEQDDRQLDMFQPPAVAVPVSE